MIYTNKYISDIYNQDYHFKYENRKNSRIKKIESSMLDEPKTYANKNFINDIIFTLTERITFYNCRFNTITIKMICRDINFVDCIIDTMILDHANLNEIRMTSCCIRNLTSIRSNIDSSFISDVNFGNIYGSYRIRAIYISRARYNEIMMNDSTINDTVITSFGKIDFDGITNTFLNCNAYGSYFTGCNFRLSYFYNCNIIDNHMSDVYLDDCISYGSKIEIPMKCPKEGAFIGYKVVQFDKPVRTNGIAEVKGIAVLEIPKDAMRINAGTNKCRCSKAKVLRIESFDGEEIKTNGAYTNSAFGNVTKYKKGKMVYPDSFDENRFNTCSNGIHFFMSREDAMHYNY